MLPVSLTRKSITIAGAPLYLHQVLGVPLGSVGSFTIWPMMVSLFGKFAVTAWESRMVAAGVDRLRLRKLSTAICSGCIFIFVPLFTLAPSPLLATLAYCGVTLGGCFEYPGFIANLLEVEGDDAMMLECVLLPPSRAALADATPAFAAGRTATPPRGSRSSCLAA